MRQRHGLARDGVQDDTRVRRKLLARERLKACRGDGPVPLNVFLEVVGRGEVVIVRVEPVGDPAEAAEALETTDDVGFNRVSCPIELGRVHRLGLVRGYFLEDGLLELVSRVTRPRASMKPETPVFVLRTTGTWYSTARKMEAWRC